MTDQLPGELADSTDTESTGSTSGGQPHQEHRSIAFWITAGMAFVALVLSGFDLLWTHWRVSDRLIFTPIGAQPASNEDDTKLVFIDFAVANLGTRSAILAELCFFPRPWGDELGNPSDYISDDMTSGIIIPSVSGVKWKTSDLQAESPLQLARGQLESRRVYFDLTPYSHADWYDDREMMRVDLFATSIDNQGGIHIQKLSDWIQYRPPGGIAANASQPTELIPGGVIPESGIFGEPDYSSVCQFIGSVFKPKN